MTQEEHAYAKYLQKVSDIFNSFKDKQTPLIAHPICPSHCQLKNLSNECLRQDMACLLFMHSPARALMRERSNSLAELLSLSSSSSDRSKRVLMLLYCCVISALSKSVVEVMAAASVAGVRVLRWRAEKRVVGGMKQQGWTVNLGGSLTQGGEKVLM